MLTHYHLNYSLFYQLLGIYVVFLPRTLLINAPLLPNSVETTTTAVVTTTTAARHDCAHI